MLSIDGADVSLDIKPVLTIPQRYLESSKSFKFTINGTQIFEGIKQKDSVGLEINKPDGPLLTIAASDEQLKINPSEFLPISNFYLNLKKADKRDRILIANFEVETCRVPFRSNKYDEHCSPIDP